MIVLLTATCHGSLLGWNSTSEAWEWAGVVGLRGQLLPLAERNPQGRRNGPHRSQMHRWAATQWACNSTAFLVFWKEPRRSLLTLQVPTL